MATRTLKQQTPAPKPDDAPATPGVEPNVPSSSPVSEPSQPESAPQHPEEKEVDTVPVDEPKQEEPMDEPKKEPRIVDLMRSDLDAIIEKAQSSMDSLKTQKAETPDQMELIKLSAAKVLREAVAKLSEMEGVVQKMSTLSREIETQQQGLNQAKEVQNARAESFRTERAAFIKLRAMDEKEYYALVNELMAREKAAKEVK